MTFLGALSQDDLRTAYRGARAVVLPGEEDFGIVPVEAMACGRPVVALGRGGALETIRSGETGLLAGDESVETLAEAMAAVEAHPFDPVVIRRHAESFGTARFESAMREHLSAALSASS